jgi:hypothetical protein
VVGFNVAWREPSICYLTMWRDRGKLRKTLVAVVFERKHQDINAKPNHYYNNHHKTLMIRMIMMTKIIQFLFICMLTQQPKGQLQSEHK